LGSGSARGLAHLGVVRALNEAGLPLHCIVGTSMGALVGAVCAAGQLQQLTSTFQAFDWRKTLSFFDVVLPRSGLLDGARVGELVREHVGSATIESLPIAYAAVSTDLVTGQEILIRQGDVIDAVRASISVPGIFTPVRRNGSILVDGGLVNPVPVSAARALGAEVVIAVDLNHQIVGGKNFKSLQAQRTPSTEMDQTTTPITLSDAAPWLAGYRRAMQDLKTRLQGSEWARGLALAQGVAPPSHQEPMPSIFEVLLASINVMETRITQTRLALEPPEVLIQPPLGHIRFLEFARADELIQIGYDAARQALATSPALQDWRVQADTA
jgi:NTE family protein